MEDRTKEYAIYLTSYFDANERCVGVKSCTQSEHLAFLMGLIDGAKEEQKDPNVVAQILNTKEIRNKLGGIYRCK